MSRPFAVTGFTVFLIAALIYNSETGVMAAAFAAFAVALVVTLFIRKARERRYLPCAFASGALICALLLASSVFTYYPAVALAGSSHEITATLISEPELKYGNYYYTAKATEIDGEAVDLKLRLTFSNYPEAEPYDEVSGVFEFYIPGSSSEDLAASYKSDGIFVAAYPSRESFEVKNIPESEKPLGMHIINIRRAVRNAIYRVLPDERGALAVALIIGDKSGLPADIYSDFQASGISHIICVSGFHVSLWSMLVFSLLKKLRLGEILSRIVCATAVIGFMLIAGFSYSVVRSGIMMFVFLLSGILMRRSDSINSLGFALTVIALFNPFAMGSVSLQLSALAALGIILYSQYLAPLIKKKTDKINNKYIKKSAEYALSTLMATVSATSFTLVVTLGLYGGFNFAVFGSNLVAVPVSSAAIVLNSLGAAFGTFLPNFTNIFGTVGGFLCNVLIRFADFVADIKWLSFRVETDASLLILCAVLSVCLLSLMMAYNGRSMPVLTVVLCAGVFVFSLLTCSLSESRVTKVVAADCGNGTSVIIGKHGETLLLGCGGTEFLGPMKIGTEVEKFGGDVDAFFVPDYSEHSSAYLGEILSDISIGSIYCNKPDRDISILLGDTPVNPIDDEYISKNFRVTSSAELSCTMVESEDARILVCHNPVEDYSLFPEDFRTADIIITRGDYPKGIENFGSDFVAVNAENLRGKLISDELNSAGIKAAATAGNGSITVKAYDGSISVYRQ